MMSQFIVGKYFNTKSIIHKIDPRIKLLSLLLLFVMIFLNGGFESYLYILALTMIVFLLSKLPFRMIYSQWKIIIFLFIFLFFLTAILSTTNKSISGASGTYSIGSWNFHKSSLTNSIYITLRIFLMLLATIILTATTKPLFLTLALEDLLSPLRIIKVPTYEISMMMTIALRFIPTFLDEAGIIIKAQASRGIIFNRGGIKKRLISIVALIIPLFLSSFQKAEDLANAMDSRGYVPGQKRTRGTKFKISLLDIIYILIIIGLLILVIISSHYIKSHSWINHWNISLHWWGWYEPSL